MEGEPRAAARSTCTLCCGPSMPLGAPTQVQECEDSCERGGPDRDEGAADGQATTRAATAPRCHSGGSGKGCDDGGRTPEVAWEGLDPACGVLMDESLRSHMNLPACSSLSTWANS
jgi:hypothetical protein